MIEQTRGEQRPPLSKSAYVLERLRRDFSNGTITPGESLRQGEIAERYGVSATPVREALRILEADGLIIYSPHRGATVAEMPQPDLRDLYLLRANVEGFTAALAVERGTDEQIAGLRRQHDDLVRVAFELSPEELSRRNRDFHLAVVAVGSPFIAGHVMRPLWERLIPPSQSLFQDADRVRNFVAEHEAVVSALERRDAEAARQHMSQHIAIAGELRQEAAEKLQG
jgi:DNA-binding GntR family transcriptional regulator